MTMKNIFAGLLVFGTLLSCEQKKDETLVLHSEAGLSLGFTHFKTFTGIVEEPTSRGFRVKILI